jgi:hypothetical protein
MESSFEFKITENINRVKYNNLYFFDNNFHFLTKDKNIILKEVKLLGGPEHTDQILKEEYFFLPKIKIFNNDEELNTFISINLITISEITNYFSHYYQHNIGHGLYDALYPSFLTLLDFYNENNNYINLINLLKPDGWICPLKCSREWVLDIMSKFSKNNNLLKDNLEKDKIYKFEILIAGSGYAGFSSINKQYLVPGKENFALEKFRDRFYNVYKIEKNIIKHNNIKIIIIDSERYSNDEKNILLKINETLNERGYNSNYIYWKNYEDFRDQLEIINNTNIHISSCGTSMMYFPFLNSNNIHINLGTNNYFDSYYQINNEERCLLMDIPISLLSNDIHIDYYDIFKNKKILFDQVIDIIEKNISYFKNKLINYNNKNINKNIPNFVKIWREFCNNIEYNNFRDEDNINEIIDKMNNDRKPDLVSIRWIEMIIQNYSPYNKNYEIIKDKNLRLLKIIKNKYITIL